MKQKIMKTTFSIISIASLSTSLSYAMAADPQCITNKTCVPVKVINNSGTNTMYLMIHTSSILGKNKNRYFDFISGKFDATGSFNKQNNIEAVHFTAGEQAVKFYLPGAEFLEDPSIPNHKSGAGGRLYISDTPLTSLPNLNTSKNLYDKVELGWSSGTAVWNTTAVDFIGFPMQISNTENGKKIIRGFKDGTTRSSLLTAVHHAMSQYTTLYPDSLFNLYSNDDANIPVRIFSPGHIITNNEKELDTSAMKNYISKGLRKITQYKNSVTYSGFIFKNFRLNQDGTRLTADVSGQGSGSTTVYGFTPGTGTAGTILNDGSKQGAMLAAMLSASFNRGVLGNPSNWGSLSSYYPNNIAGNELNIYAKIISHMSIDHKAYAISYSDYWNMEASLLVGAKNNSPVTITIMPFGGGSTNPIGKPIPEARKITQHSAEIFWPKVNDTDPKDPTPTYSVALKNSSLAAAGVNCNDNVCSQIFTGLSANTSYQAEVKASAGTHQSEGNTTFKTTGAGPTPGKSQTYSISAGNGNSYSINGTNYANLNAPAKKVDLLSGENISIKDENTNNVCNFTLSAVGDKITSQSSGCTGIVISSKKQPYSDKTGIHYYYNIAFSAIF